ncbi:MAG TPA: helix-turn-helix domain-containing protein, partial [Novosphingobium sp.]|nr:helix-turn-helix domain-containing protein [Novosphingobium sp.]
MGSSIGYGEALAGEQRAQPARLLPRRGRPRADDAAGITDRLVESAWQVLLEFGPDHFSLERMAQAVRASKQTIYARFGGKADLLRAVLDSRLRYGVAELSRLADLPTPEEAFYDLAFRAAIAFSEPEARMLDRLIDWVDANQTETPAVSIRPHVAEQFLKPLHDGLVLAGTRWGLVVDAPERAARHWLDCMIGHVRGPVLPVAAHRAWALDF